VSEHATATRLGLPVHVHPWVTPSSGPSECMFPASMSLAQTRSGSLFRRATGFDLHETRDTLKGRSSRNTISVMRIATILKMLAVVLGLIVDVAALAAEHSSPVPADGAPTLQIVEQAATPVLSHGMRGTEGNRYGFEGGCVLKLNNAYHLFVSEMVEDPFWVKMKLAHWSSADGRQWQRVSTLLESSGNYDGTDPRAAVWAPMPVYSDQDERWNLFYVAYRCAPDPPDRWLTNHEGRIWRAVSQTPGPDGYGGPYGDVGIVLEPGVASDTWEGLQGTDSFFPFRVGDRWLAFYGSANTQDKQIGKWQVGLAEAASLTGTWKRLSASNPVALDPELGVENPVVTRLRDSTYIAVFDIILSSERFGYATSPDGLHWSRAQHPVLDSAHSWVSDMRTPLGLIDEGGDQFTLYYTGYSDLPGVGKYGSVGLLRLKLVHR
jgi:hypothetical protein